MKKSILAIVLLSCSFVSNAATAFLQSQSHVAGATICYYNYIGKTYQLVVSGICPLSVEVNPF